MKFRPEVKLEKSDDHEKKTGYYVGFKGTMTFEEVKNVFSKIKNLFKKNKRISEEFQFRLGNFRFLEEFWIHKKHIQNQFLLCHHPMN